MKCPVCGKQAITKIKFYIFSNPRKFKCQECNQSLIPDLTLKKIQRYELVFAAIFGFIYVHTIISNEYSFYGIHGNFLIIPILLFISIGIIPFEYFSWKHGKLLAKNDSKT